MGSKPQTQPDSPVSGFVVGPLESRNGKVLNVVGDEIRVKVSSQDTNGAFAVAEDHCPPSGGPPLHRHFVQDEWWYIVEGQFRFEVDGVEIHAGPGDTVFAPRGSAHTFQNIGATEGRTIVTVVPGGLDLFFEEVSETVVPGAAPDPAAIAELFRKHGMEMLGPTLAHRTRD